MGLCPKGEIQLYSRSGKSSPPVPPINLTPRPTDPVQRNPPLVLGPVVHYSNSLLALNTSDQTTRDLMTGAAKSSCPPTRNFLFFDVRDVALAHVLAAEKDGAGGKRLFIVGGRYCNKEIAEIIGEAYPELKANLLQGEAHGFDNGRSKSVLGLTYRLLRESIVDLVKRLQALETD